MSDIVDDAQAAEQLFLLGALRKRQQSATQPVKGTGSCLSCGEAITDERKRWCGPECRDEWQKEQRRGG